MRNLTGTLLLLVVLLAVPASYAEAVVCGGTVQTLAYHQPGKLLLRLSSMNTPVYICSTDADWVVPGSLAGSTSPAACKAIYATLLAAKTSGAPIPDMYFDGDQLPANCISFAPWSEANVRYFSF
ncbi:hypothetical protein SAMN06269301_1977 [Geobacter sp. DSM 9736]|nr:hypothetical protein SAMN06269301_1977 [Geobacter sp. DSM 9736]